MDKLKSVLQLCYEALRNSWRRPCRGPYWSASVTLHWLLLRAFIVLFLALEGDWVGDSNPVCWNQRTLEQLDEEDPYYAACVTGSYSTALLGDPEGRRDRPNSNNAYRGSILAMLVLLVLVQATMMGMQDPRVSEALEMFSTPPVSIGDLERKMRRVGRMVKANWQSFGSTHRNMVFLHVGMAAVDLLGIAGVVHFYGGQVAWVLQHYSGGVDVFDPTDPIAILFPPFLTCKLDALGLVGGGSVEYGCFLPRNTLYQYLNLVLGAFFSAGLVVNVFLLLRLMLLLPCRWWRYWSLEAGRMPHHADSILKAVGIGQILMLNYLRAFMVEDDYQEVIELIAAAGDESASLASD